MKESKIKFENKGLVILLCALALVIVGLGIGIGVVMLNGREEEVVVESGPTEEQILYDEYTAYTSSYNDLEAKVQGLLNESPINVEKIRELYSERINKYIGDGNYGRANAFIDAERKALLSKGLERDALDAMLEVDFSVFPEPAQYRSYVEIVRLAEELGDTAVALRYQGLADGVKEAYDANYAESERIKAESERSKAESEQYNEEGDAE